MTLSTTMPQTEPCGPTTPRSLEVLVEHLRAEAPCHYCGSTPGARCNGRLRHSVHLARFVRAFVRGQITGDELAIAVKPRGDNFTGATIIRTGAR